ncbi:MAG: NAD(P)H-hydrate dehydratase [Spirochaetes bacterium]|nr:NAD(P)H-hydrate dehydratase [Spirochaetota bacterium]
MENGGIGVVYSILKKYPKERISAVLAGPGNNGGDGLVIARHLFFSDHSITVFYIGDRKKATKNNRKNLLICKKLNIPVIFIQDKRGLEKYKDLIAHHELMIDAMLGIGLNGPLSGLYLETVRFINSLNNRIRIAVDIPTGLSADTGDVGSDAFRADLTVTFGAPKIGHVFSPAKAFAGEVTVKNIGFPKELLEHDRLKLNLITKEGVQRSQGIPFRKESFHKNDFGHAVIFAGSLGKSGSAIMASRASIRSGAGLVTVIAPEQINEILETNLVEVMTLPVDISGKDNSFNRALPLFDKADVILAGCGITTSSDAAGFLKRILSLKDKVIVLDADALNIISEDLSLLKSRNQIVLTPHIGEMSRLTGISTDEILKKRIDITRKFAKENQVIVVLKASETIIADPDGNLFINNCGNEGMATAGSGDVLSGIVTGLLSQNIKQGRSILAAVVAGVFLHSLAGDLALEEKGSHSLIASDIIDHLYKAFTLC